MSIIISVVTSWDSTLPKDIEHYEGSYLDFVNAVEFAEQLIIERNEDATIELGSKAFNGNCANMEILAFIEDEVVARYIIAEEEIS